MIFLPELYLAAPRLMRSTTPIPGMAHTARRKNHCNGVRISLEHDLSFTKYTLEVRVYNDGVAFRHVIPGELSSQRVPDEYSAFLLPSGSVVWYGGLESGHYETDYVRKDISEVQPGEWAGPPLTLSCRVKLDTAQSRRQIW